MLGGVFFNRKVKSLLSRLGIEHIISPPQLNGSKLPEFLWAEAC